MSLAKTLGLISVVGVTLASLSSGCTSAETEAAPPTNVLATEAGFCTELGKIICNENVVTACYLSDPANLDSDTSACVSNASKRACNTANRPYVSKDAAKCIAEYKKMYTDARLERGEIDAVSEACLTVFPGSGNTNSSCVVNEDCDGASGLRCVAGTDESTCQIPNEVDAGFPCEDAGDVCVTGFYCKAGTCAVREDVNEMCDADLLCNEELRCVSGICLQKEANGADCTTANECTGGFCIKKSGEQLGQCGGFVPLTFDGEACGLLN